MATPYAIRKISPHIVRFSMQKYKQILRYKNLWEIKKQIKKSQAANMRLTAFL